jgi:subtilisin family serine protease
MLRHCRALVLVLLPFLLLATIIQARTPEPGMLLRLQVGTFDPLHDAPLGAIASPREGAEPYQIVQFAGPVQATWVAQAEAVGATLLGYLPDNAYVARVDQADLPALRSLPSVRWVGPYEPAYKVAPAFAPQLLRASAGQSVRVTLVSFPGEPPEELRALLAGLGAAVEELAATPLGVLARATLPAGAVVTAAQQPSISWIEPYVEPRLADAPARGIMGAERIWAGNGLFGEGQIVAISDSGLDVQLPGGNVGSADLAGRLVRAYAPSEMRPDSPACAAKTTWTDLNGHGTHVAGSVLGNGANSGANPAGNAYTSSNAGLAPRARYVFMAMNTDGSGGIQCVPSNGNYIAFGYQSGARISTNSWGGNTNGVYTANDSVIDDYIWRNRDYLVLFAAGNSGPDRGTIGSPGSAKNIISVGAGENNRPDLGPNDPVGGGSISDNPNSLAYFSSRGPTADGRIKPDIVAPGTNIVSVLGSEARGLEPIAPGSPYALSSGTSMATPLTAGAAALVREWLVTQRNIPNPSAALIKALLIHGAFQLPGVSTPNPSSGWGRVDLGGTLGSSYALFEDDQAGLRSGEQRVYTVEVAGATANGTLFVSQRRPGASGLRLIPQPLPPAAPAAAAGDPQGLAVEPVPGYETPRATPRIADQEAVQREQLPANVDVPRPAPGEARALAPSPNGVGVRDFLQNMVGGGDFEDPAWSNVWSQVWLGEGRPVRTSDPAQVVAGRASVWLGGSDSDDLIAYPVSFPERIDTSSPSALQFLVRQTNLDPGFDYFCVAMADASGYTLRSADGPMISCADQLPPGVQGVSLVFSAAERAVLAGQTAYLYLFTFGDGLRPHMSAFVDNVALNVDFPPVAVTALPQAGPPGTTFLLRSVHNVPYGGVQVCVDSCDGDGALGTVYADDRGDALAYITTQSSAAPGTYRFVTRNIAGRSGQTSITLLGGSGPTLRVSPASGVAGATFTFEGAGFVPNDSEIEVQVNGSVLGTVGSNDAGAVRFEIVTRGSTPAGSYQVRVVDSAGRTGQAAYQVAAPSAGSPQLAVTPASGPPGARFDFTGSGFAPGGQVSLTLDGTPVGQVTADSSGGFGLQLETAATITPGSYTLEARQGSAVARASFEISGGGGEQPAGGAGLRVSLVWTDPPGQPGAARALVNNLDLRVEGPNNQVWLGNGGTGPDQINNVETVRVAQPAPGTYRIIVQGSAVNATFGAQPFALLATSGQNNGASLDTAPIGPGQQRIYLPIIRRVR